VIDDAPGAERERRERVVEVALGRLDMATKVRLLSGQGFWRLPAVPSIGLRPVVMSDGPIGIRGTAWDPEQPSIALPAPVALAATWDVSLAHTVGQLLGQEARRRGVDVLLAPTVNLHRSPLGGRHFECYSEDPLLSGEIGAAYVAGVQQMGVAAAVKAFVANDSETERLTVDVRVSERALREVYLGTFETIVRRAGPWALMAAYNRVNGVAMTEHRHLLRDVLKEEWGFDGAVISDWTAARSTVETVLGGLDVAMPAMGNPWGPALAAAVQNGKLDEELVDEQARRVLRLAARVGALECAPSDAGDRAMEPLDPTHVARIVAARSFVLVRNVAEALPMQPRRLHRMALIGALATDIRAFGGGSAEVTPPHVVSPLDGLRSALPSNVELIHVVGTDPRQRLPIAGGPEWGERFTVRLLGVGGEVLRTLRAPTGQVRWYGDPPAGVAAANLTAIELTCTLTPAVGGVHTLSVSGVGACTLFVDGALMLSAGTERDAGATFTSPPERRLPVALAESVPIEVSVIQQVERVGGLPVFVTLTLGYAPPSPSADEMIAEAVREAATADVAVVLVGTTEAADSDGLDRSSLALPGRQDELVARVAEVNDRTVVVVNAGAPVVMPWVDDVAAILLIWLPGQEAGAALADVMLGWAEPGGRLPTTWPRREEDCPVLSTRPHDGVLVYDEDVFVGYRAWQRSGVAPLYPFGHGLGYTTWAYESLSIEPDEGLGTARVRVRNTGSRPGGEVIQLYLRPAVPDDRRPDRWLAGFAVAHAAPGETATVDVRLSSRSAQIWDSDADSWRTMGGRYAVAAAHSLADWRLAMEIQVDEPFGR
jgi:beta-glucosidase